MPDHRFHGRIIFGPQLSAEKALSKKSLFLFSRCGGEGYWGQFPKFWSVYTELKDKGIGKEKFYFLCMAFLHIKIKYRLIKTSVKRSVRCRKDLPKGSHSFFFFFFRHTHGVEPSPQQRHSSDNAGSLTCCATRELFIQSCQTKSLECTLTLSTLVKIR